MADKGELNELFRKTEREPSAAQAKTSAVGPKVQAETFGPPDFPFATGNIKSTGVGLREGELALLAEMAERWGVGRNFVARWLVICGLQRYLVDDLPEPPRKLP